MARMAVAKVAAEPWCGMICGNRLPNDLQAVDYFELNEVVWSGFRESNPRIHLGRISAKVFHPLKDNGRKNYQRIEAQKTAFFRTAGSVSV